jgi:hypothetical protein
MDKDKKKTSDVEKVTEVLLFIFALFFIWIMIARVQQLLVYYGTGNFDSIWAYYLNYFLTHIWPFIKVMAAIVGALSIAGLYYNYSKLSAIVLAEKAIYSNPPIVGDTEEEKPLVNDKWLKVQQLIASTNESDWRQAIIEADIMLDELLTAQGYHGDSIGDKLQSVEPSDFLTLDNAWTAHKVRNRIAHDGASFQLNEREAKQTISDFEKVFTEFKMI